MCKTITLGCKLWPWKLGLKKSFKSFYLKIVRLFHKPYSARDFVPIKCIFFRFSVRKVSFQLPQNVTWTNGIMHGITIRHKWGKIGPSYLFCKHVNLSFFYSISSKQFLVFLVGNIQGKVLKNQSTTSICFPITYRCLQIIAIDREIMFSCVSISSIDNDCYYQLLSCYVSILLTP